MARKIGLARKAAVYRKVQIGGYGAAVLGAVGVGASVASGEILTIPGSLGLLTTGLAAAKGGRETARRLESQSRVVTKALKRDETRGHSATVGKRLGPGKRSQGPMRGASGSEMLPGSSGADRLSGPAKASTYDSSQRFGAAAGVALGVGVAAGVGAKAARSGHRPITTGTPRAPKAKAAAKAVGRAAGKTAKATHKAAKATGKVATMAVLPAAHVVADAVKHRAHIAGAVKAAAAGDRTALAAMAKRAPLPLSTLILPAIAGVAAISAARDALRRGKSTTEAVGEGGYKAGDVVLGGAMSAYAEHREAGRTRMESIARATLTGIDNRLLFGLGQHLVNLQRATVNEQQQRGDYELRQASLEAEQGAVGGGVNGGGDQTTLAIARAFGPKDVGAQPAAGSAQALPGGGGRLTADQRRDFTARNEATQQPTKARSANPEATEDVPSGRKPGWGPEAHIAAYFARNPGGTNVPYGGDPRNAEDYVEPKSKGEMR